MKWEFHVSSGAEHNSLAARDLFSLQLGGTKEEELIFNGSKAEDEGEREIITGSKV
jgi:hypothetical protein